MTKDKKLEAFRKAVAKNSFDRLMKFEILDIEDGYSEMALTTDPEMHGNARGEAHGGVLISFSDTAMGVACFSLGKKVSTLDLNGNFVKKVMLGERITAKSQVEHNGSRTMVATTHHYNEKGDLVYTGRGTFFVLGTFDPAEFA